MNVAAVVADGLVRAGVRRVFASPAAPAALLDAVRARDLRVVDAAGPAAACIMAAVTGELGDAPGAVLVTLGDRLAAVVDGAAHATRDRAAVIVISDGADDERLLAPAVKASVVADAASAGHWIAHAAQAAMAEPRGAVHLAIPAGIVRATALPVAASCRRAPLPPPPAETLDALAATIAAAVRPVLVAGVETRTGDAAWIRALAESLPAPVLTTPKGKGALPDPHPLALGLVDAGHPLLAQTDLLILVGVDPAELRPGVQPAAGRVVSIGRSVADDVVFGEIALIIEELAPRLRERAHADWDVAALDRLKRSLRVSSPGPGLARRRVVELVREATPAGTVLALDVPLADAWASVAPRDCLVASGVATLGFALPAALAAALAREDARAVAIGAAAGFEAMAGEWATAARLGAPIVAVALNQAGAADVTRAARAAGVGVATAGDEAAFGAAFERAWRADTPMLVDAHVSR